MYNNYSNERYLVIATITDNNLELVAIRNGMTDQTIFYEFINQLGVQIQAKYRQDKKRFILTADGAKYHWTEKVKNTIKENEIMMIQTVDIDMNFHQWSSSLLSEGPYQEAVEDWRVRLSYFI